MLAENHRRRGKCSWIVGSDLKNLLTANSANASLESVYAAQLAFDFISQKEKLEW